MELKLYLSPDSCVDILKQQVPQFTDKVCCLTLTDPPLLYTERRAEEFYHTRGATMG